MSRTFVTGDVNLAGGEGDPDQVQAMASIVDSCGNGAVQAIMTLTGEGQANCTGGLLQYAMSTVVNMAPVEGEAFVRALIRSTVESARTQKPPSPRLVDSVMRTQHAWLEAANRNVEAWGEHHAAGGKVQ